MIVTDRISPKTDRNVKRWRRQPSAKVPAGECIPILPDFVTEPDPKRLAKKRR